MNLCKAISSEVFKYLSTAAYELSVETYVIGGFVRDHILNRKNKEDIDIVCVGDGIKLAKTVAKLLPNKPKVQFFKTYGTAMIKYQNLQIEFVGARRESYSEESRNPKVEKGTLKDDQCRRDFTINALAISLNQDTYGNLIDPFNGISDLENKKIITPLEPNITFSDDPLRMLRAIRFAAQLEFKIDDTTLKAISNNAARLKIITKERIATEINKILMSQKPSIGFKLLEQTDLLTLILPELVNLKGVEEIAGESHKDNFYHSLEVVDNIASNTNNLWLRWAALLHDIGKAKTKKFDQRIGWTFHNHEFVGSKMIYHIFKRLKLPLHDTVKYIQKLVRMSSRPIAVIGDQVTDSAVRRLIFDANNDLDDLMILCDADITTKNPKRYQKYHNNFKIVRQKIVEVEERDHVKNFQPPISGELIMKQLNLPPSREVGVIKEAIKEAILEGEIPNNYDACFRFMLEKAQQMGLSKT